MAKIQEILRTSHDLFSLSLSPSSAVPAAEKSATAQTGKRRAVRFSDFRIMKSGGLSHRMTEKEEEGKCDMCLLSLSLAYQKDRPTPAKTNACPANLNMSHFNFATNGIHSGTLRSDDAKIISVGRDFGILLNGSAAA